MEETNQFPEGFLWGAGTSAYQIEGAANHDGRTPSVWDHYCHATDSVRNRENGDTACDHYHRYSEDVALMEQIGLQAYRFSVSWTRVVPHHSGEASAQGLDFYERLVDRLLDSGIQPWVTLFHWDFPQDRFEQGGWLNPESPHWFAEYARRVVDRLSDRVRHWITINEPQSFLHFGHATGSNAPGLKLDLADQLLAAHHVLLAHGHAAAAIREHAKQTPLIGWAPVGCVASPAELSDQNIDAARRSTMSVAQANLWNNTWFDDPVFLGHYPEDGIRILGAAVPPVTDQQMQVISTPIDFLGLNIYMSTPTVADDSGGWKEANLSPGHPHTAFDWPIAPEGLHWGPLFHWERYNKPIYITENGMANLDWVQLDGRVHDPQRIDFTNRSLRELRTAIDAGADIRGYFHWSLLDNFEWAEGYSKRFGLVHVDFQTQARTLKDSAHWFRQVIESNGAALW